MEAISALGAALKLMDTSQGLARALHSFGYREGSLTVENRTDETMFWAFGLLGTSKNPTRSYGWFRLEPGETFGKSVNTYRTTLFNQYNHWYFAAINEEGTARIPMTSQASQAMPVACSANEERPADCTFTIRWIDDRAMILSDESHRAKKIVWVPCLTLTQHPGREIGFIMDSGE
ncbi:hypothetical protein ACIPRL_18195 [Streptomyces sp. NPDC090085]|uniref:hypothetical protein n=1 Tax=Streptomyces sp. NPDC090085 TaxID=3365943 RepID=UPI003814D999